MQFRAGENDLEHKLPEADTKTCQAGTDVALSLRVGVKTTANVFVRRIQEQIVELAARRAWAQQDYMGAVSLAVGFFGHGLRCCPHGSFFD